MVLNNHPKCKVFDCPDLVATVRYEYQLYCVKHCIECGIFTDKKKRNWNKIGLLALAAGLGSLLIYGLVWGITHPYQAYCALYEPDGGWNC